MSNRDLLFILKFVMGNRPKEAPFSVYLKTGLSYYVQNIFISGDDNFGYNLIADVVEKNGSVSGIVIAPFDIISHTVFEEPGEKEFGFSLRQEIQKEKALPPSESVPVDLGNSN